MSAAGFAATAISFGPARMGFGLFVPEFRSEFGMSTAAVGYVSSLGFLGFLVGLLIAQALLARWGPRLPVLSGLAAASAGMLVVALATNLAALALGVFLAASSAGLAWTPFNDAIHGNVRDEKRPSALSAVSTGTAVGIIAAGLAALAMVLAGFSWRLSWGLFAAAGAIALLGNWAVLRRVEGQEPHPVSQIGWRQLIDVSAVPLLAIGFAFGTTSAIYIAFAADHVVEAGGVPNVPIEATPALLYMCYGLFGLVGLLTGRIRDMIGLPTLLRLLMLAGAVSLVLLSVSPGSLPGLSLSAGLQGMHVMMTSAVLAFWSERLFPSSPSRGFTAALLAAAVGNVSGPALAGLASDAFGAAPMFLGAAALPAITAILLRDRHGQERPA
nr:MFS transporter [Chelativorans sp. ZYF759]